MNEKLIIFDDIKTYPEELITYLNTIDPKEEFPKIDKYIEKLLNEYKLLKLKLNSGIENRQMLLSSLGKRSKSLNQPYKNRIYTEEELKKIMED